MDQDIRDESRVPELLTPEQVEATFFPDAERGYDRAHVDAFVIEIARQLRYLAEEFAHLEERSSAPYMRVGKEMAELLDHARKVSEGITSRAREEATALSEEARELRREAGERLVRAQEEAHALLESARVRARKLTEEAENAKRLAEVHASIVEDDLKREATKLKQKAEGVLAAARDRADLEYAEARKAAEARVRKLEEIERVMRKRLSVLKASSAS
jgi:DivIVA domain-containing protein